MLLRNARLILADRVAVGHVRIEAGKIAALLSHESVLPPASTTFGYTTCGIPSPAMPQ